MHFLQKLYIDKVFWGFVMVYNYYQHTAASRFQRWPQLMPLSCRLRTSRLAAKDARQGQDSGSALRRGFHTRPKGWCFENSHQIHVLLLPKCCNAGSQA